MATYIRTVREDIEIDAPTAAEATVYFEVGTHEAQTVTVSKGGGAFGATGGSVASQVDGTVYKLVIHADDADTLGDLAFKCVGATDTQYILGIRVVDHDPFDAIAAILADTGTDGVVLGADAITSDALAATAIAEIADAVWEEPLADHDGTAGSIAEALLLIMQRGCGKIVTDNGDGTIKVYDTDNATLLLTITKGTAGDETTWTPS
jgi:hypothetical protein